MEKTGCCITNDSGPGVALGWGVSAPVSRQHCHCHNCGPTLGISTNCALTCYSCIPFLILAHFLLFHRTGTSSNKIVDEVSVD